MRLRTWDERRVIAPLGDFTSDSFGNWTKQDPSLMMHVGLELGNRANVDALREPFREFAQSDEDAIGPDDAVCEGISQNARATTVRFMVRAEDPKKGWGMHRRQREHMFAAASRLDAAAGHEPTPAFLPREREVRMDAEG